MTATQELILSQKVCAGRIRTNAPTPGYNIQSLFRILPQHTVALRCAKSLELPQNGFLRGNQELATIERVKDIRSIWPNEADNFTPWLADNLSALGKALVLDLDLEDVVKEAPVGTFKLDIRTRVVGSGRPVVIENQLGSTDHSHLGQLLTYAAGFDANVIVWIAEEFKDEHREALDLLNRRTDEESEFFGVVVEVWKIDDSRPAPHFRVVSAPNDWRKQSIGRRRQANVSEKGEQYRQFWQPLLERLNREDGWNVRTDNTASWFTAGSGIAEVWRNMSFYVRNREAAVELSLQTPNKDWNKSFFDLLKESRGEIEAELGTDLMWERLDDNKTSRVGIRRRGSMDAPPQELDEIRSWMFDNVVRFKQIFPPYLREVRDRLPRP